MKCFQVEEILQNYLDGHLPNLPERASDHLRSCAACRAAYDEMMALRQLMQQLPASRLTPWSERQLVRLIKEKLPYAEKRAAREPVWRPLLPRWYWRVVVPVGMAALVIWMLLFGPGPFSVRQEAEMAGPPDIDLLIQEHSLAEGNTIFGANAPALNLVALEEPR